MAKPAATASAARIVTGSAAGAPLVCVNISVEMFAALEPRIRKSITQRLRQRRTRPMWLRSCAVTCRRPHLLGLLISLTPGKPLLDVCTAEFRPVDQFACRRPQLRVGHPERCSQCPQLAVGRRVAAGEHDAQRFTDGGEATGCRAGHTLVREHSEEDEEGRTGAAADFSVGHDGRFTSGRCVSAKTREGTDGSSSGEGDPEHCAATCCGARSRCTRTEIQLSGVLAARVGQCSGRQHRLAGSVNRSGIRNAEASLSEVATTVRDRREGGAHARPRSVRAGLQIEAHIACHVP
jgi:hypothetical protein